MLACPNCDARIAHGRTPVGVVYSCPSCGGRMVGVAVLRKDRAAGDFLRAVWQGARKAQESMPSRSCPHCTRPMAQAEVPAGAGSLTVDVCLRCSCIWFDPGEYADVPRAPEPAKKEELPAKARALLALDKIEKMQREYEKEAGKEGPDEAWQYLPAIFGLPVECGAPSVTARPWVTWGVAAFAIAVFIVTAWDLRAAVQGWGLVPDQWYRRGGLTVVSSFFLHGGVFHLVSNLYFLIVFGDNVEDDLGTRRFVALLVASHLAGMAAHVLFEPRSSLPCVGASAGISGVIAYYAVAFPRARLGFFLFLRFAFRWIRMSAAVAFALWIGLQLLGAWKQIAGFTNVSAVAHLGGAAVGLAAAFTLHARRRKALSSVS